MYALGIDLGTTFTAAATWRDGHAEIASLGSRAAVIPSVVLLRADETVLTGETANRRGLTEPHRVSREFKRRLGDTTPILLGGTPYSADALMGKLLRAVIDEVTGREGGQPSRICVSHPANWGPYKKDLLQQAVRMAGIDVPVTFTTEPEAAAVFYALQQRVDPGAVVAVYDLGGGTFDAAVLRKTSHGFEILGQPEGIERLGGVDFDAAVFSHVSRSLGGKLEELDEDDPTAVAAVARLREECVSAKEALSSDTDASIPVLLPNLSTEIRITRAELEAMVRPTLHSSIEALRRALRSAGVTADQLHSVLLVGGSSRMPLVAQLVGAELGRPVAVDAHPKHAVALGAAWLASGVEPSSPPAPTHAGPTGTGPAASGAVRAGLAGAGLAAAGMAGAGMAGGGPAGAGAGPAAAGPVPGPRYAGTAAVPPVHSGNAHGGPVHGGPVHGGPVHGGSVHGGPPVSPPPPPRGSAPMAARSTEFVSPVPPQNAPPAPPGPPSPRPRSWRPLLITAGVLVLALAAGTVAYAVASNDPGGGTQGGGETPEPTGDPTEDPQLPADEQCTEQIMSNDRWVCLTSAVFDGNQLVIEYDADWAGGVPDINGGFHLHVYGGDGTDPPDEIMGNQATSPGNWVIKDDDPVVLDAEEFDQYVGEQPKVCARIADGSHALVPAEGGGFTTGNCVPVQRQ
jgi:actin-like ATPase involved in cell morphogenesis